METQCDGRVLNIEQQPNFRDELQVGMSEIQLSNLHTDIKWEEENVLIHISSFQF